MFTEWLENTASAAVARRIESDLRKAEWVANTESAKVACAL